jgi:hypothetical protein
MPQNRLEIMKPLGLGEARRQVCEAGLEHD